MYEMKCNEFMIFAIYQVRLVHAVIHCGAKLERLAVNH